MNSIGFDVHKTNVFMVAVNDRGKITHCREYPTTEKNVIKLVTMVPGPRQVMFEEGGMAGWMKMVVEPYADKVIVCDPTQNRLISKAEFNDDKSSATKLAQLLLLGNYKEVYHPQGKAAELRSLFMQYYYANHDITRYKNRLKACFRQMAIPVSGSSVYNPNNRADWLAKLAEYPHLHSHATRLFRIIDRHEKIKQKILRQMRKLACKQPAYKLLQTMPGVGPLIACGYMAQIVTPDRFSQENKLWAYAGFANSHRESGGVIYSQRSSQSGNRPLKWVVSQHFRVALRCSKPNRFKDYYHRRIQQGKSCTDARRDTCRCILSSVRAIWSKEKPYRNDHVSKPQ